MGSRETEDANERGQKRQMERENCGREEKKKSIDRMREC